MHLSDNVNKQSWWSTLPGMLTALGGVIVAVTGLLAGLNAAGLIGHGAQVQPGQQEVPPTSTMKITLSYWEITGNCGEGGQRPGGDFYFNIQANGLTLARRERNKAIVNVPYGSRIPIEVSKEIKAPASGVAINATLRDRDSGNGSDPELKFTLQLPQGARGEFSVNSSSPAYGCNATLVLAVG